MKITIHAGTHKTGTTSFQKLCFSKKEVLCSHGLFIPEFTNKNKITNFATSRGMEIYNFCIQHNFLAWYLQLKKIDEVKDFLSNAYKNAIKQKCNSVLISAEDFENILIDEYMAHTMEIIAKEIGYNEIEWIFVKRTPFDYLNSLYSELSKYGLVYDFYQLYKIIMIHGYYKSTSQFYNNIYIFDLDNLVKSFKKSHSSTISILQFENFKKPYIGFPIFKELITVDKLKIEEEEIIHENKSLTSYQIEFNYVCNFLRLNKGLKSYENNKDIIDTLISHRIQKIKKENKLIKDSINEKFG